MPSLFATVGEAMTITEAAQQRLHRLCCRKGATGGLRVRGLIGSCRGSAPQLRPATGPEPGDTTVRAGDVTLYLDAQLAATLDNATLDYDGTFMGKGLTVSWPHRQGCACKDGKAATGECHRQATS